MQIITWVIAAYLAICAVVYFGNRIIIYFPDPARIPYQAMSLVPSAPAIFDLFNAVKTGCHWPTRSEAADL